LSPIRIIVRMPEPENLKVEDLSKSVKQAPHSEQATGHGMHCREILFTPRCSPRARLISRVGSTFLYDVRLRSYGTSNVPNFRILAFVGGTCAPPSALPVSSYSFQRSMKELAILQRSVAISKKRMSCYMSS